MRIRLQKGEFLFMTAISATLTSCGTNLGPSILDRGASLGFSDVVITRGLTAKINPSVKAGSHAEIPSNGAFKLVSCSLPAGLSFNADTGAISGVPTNVQTSTSCTAKFTDSLGNVALSAFYVTVADLWTDASNAIAGFQQGTMTSTTWDSTNSVLRLVTSANQSFLDSSWTPQWSHLKGYWRMDNDWTDSSGNSNDGAPAGGAPTFTASSKVGPAAGSFDGSSYVSAPSSASLNFTAQMTVMTWIFISSSTRNFWLFSKNAPGFATGFGVAFEHPTGKIWPHLGIGGGLHNPKSNGATAYGQWNHIVVTYDGSNIYIYLNGVLDSTIPQSGAIGVNGSDLYIGNSPGSPGEYLNGKIDELAIWDVALTQSEIQEVYARQLPQFSGSFVSRVFDDIVATSWRGIRWSTPIPFGKELTGDANGDNTITSSDSETPSVYSAIATNLMSGLKGLWHFNETAAAAGGVGNDLKDSSGGGLWLNGHASLAYAGVGRFGYAAKFDGAASYASASDAALPAGTSPRTVSIWINPSALPGANTSSAIVGWGTAAMDQGYGIALHNAAGTQKVSSFGYSDDFEANNTLPLYVWTHIVTTFDGTNAAIYINGSLAGTQAQGAWNTVLGGALSVGRNISNNQYFSGYIDELAIWDRALSSAEVIQIYRRGANRLRLQVRSCSDVACASGSPSWLGPDGTSLTYFVELYNSLANTLMGIPLVSGPNMLFSNFGAPLSTNLSRSQYFQYRVLMESDDANNLCDYGSGPAGCSPELQSVVSGPDY